MSLIRSLVPFRLGPPAFAGATADLQLSVPSRRHMRDPCQQDADILAHRGEEAFGIDPHPQRSRRNWREHQPFAFGQIRHRGCVRVLRHAISNPCIEVEHVSGAQDDPQRRNHRHPTIGFIRPDQRQKLTHEIGCAG